MSNILTPRQLEITTRFITRQVVRVRQFDIPSYDDVRDTHVYHKHIGLDDGRTLNIDINVVESDSKVADHHYDDEDGQFFSVIELAYKGKRIWHKMFPNMKITLSLWQSYLVELNRVIHCESCERCFMGEELKYCDLCDPFITNHDEDCSICLSNKEGVWSKTPCNHYFHYECLNNVERTYNPANFMGSMIKCPMCRFEMKTIEKM